MHALFDAAHYARVAGTNDGLSHYLTVGWQLGLDPHPLFGTRHYLGHSRDVAGAGVCPLVHYTQHGAFELRSPHPLFDPEHYIAHFDGTWDHHTDPLRHYLAGDDGDGRRPNAWFDGEFYRRHSPDVVASGVDPLAHYAVSGWREGRRPHEDFDVVHYLRTNPDVAAAGIEPLAHFLRIGARQGRSPAPHVDVVALAARGADIAAHELRCDDVPSSTHRRLVVLTDHPAAFAEHRAVCPLVEVAEPGRFVPGENDVVYFPDAPSTALTPVQLVNVAVCLARAAYDFVVVSHGAGAGSVASVASAANAVVLSADAHARRRAGEALRVGSRGRFVRLLPAPEGARDVALDDLGLGPIARDGGELTVAGRGSIVWRPVPTLLPVAPVVAHRHPARRRLLVLGAAADGAASRAIGDDDRAALDVTVATIQAGATAGARPDADPAELVVELDELGPRAQALRTIEVLRDDLRPDGVWLDPGSPWLARHADEVRHLFPATPILELPAIARPKPQHGTDPGLRSSRAGAAPHVAGRGAPALTVVVGTTGDAATLPTVLAALDAQILDGDDADVLVVAETAGDELRRWVDGQRRRLVVLPGAGVAGRLGLGVFLATAPLVMFLADDERAEPGLVVEHLRAHARFPQPEVAIVGHTTWAGDAAASPLTERSAAVDDVPLGYPDTPRSLTPHPVHLRARQLSVKRAFLARRGVFDPSFNRFPDVELGLRLQEAGIDLRYWSHARSSRLGRRDIDEQCAELTADGSELVRLARADPSGLVAELGALNGAAGTWRRAAATFDDDLAAARAMPVGDHVEHLHRGHELRWASRARGIAAALAGPDPSPAPRRPVVIGRPPALAAPSGPRPRVLVTGVVLADRPNSAAATAAELAAAAHYDVDQRWVVVGEPRRRSRAAPTLADRFVATRRAALAPKFAILGEVLAAAPLSTYEHVVLVDDDVDLPAGFLDRFLDLQRALDFALAQPARSAGSPADHPIVLQQPGSLARRTLFVEIGPVLSIDRRALDAVLPFDLRSPMGWGYETVWSHRLGERSAIGIIDATPIDHRLRPTAALYAETDCAADSAALLAAVAHRPLDDCMRVLEVHPLDARGG